MNLPVLLGTKRAVGRQAGGYKHLCDLACNITARWVNHQSKGKPFLASSLYIHLFHLVKTPHGWVNGNVGTRAEKAKGLKCTRGRRVDSKCFASPIPLSHGHGWSPGRSFSSVAVFSNGVNNHFGLSSCMLLEALSVQELIQKADYTYLP